ncbi:MAG: PAS domain S-box protein [Prolixibacteraceae bacterium]|nr:PAS domain S-box protein [Prolixibacteraceae bacterium]
MKGQKENNNKGKTAGKDELSKANEWFNFVIEATNTGTWKWNVQTGETVFNETWANMIGYGLDELGKTTIETWSRLCHPDDLKEAKEKLDRHFRGETGYYEAELRMKHKDGHWIWINDRGKVSEWTPDGKPLWMSGTHQDITRQKKTEESLKLEEARLEGLLRISQFPAGTLQQLLDFALNEAITLTGSEIGYIYFYDEETQKFKLNSWSKEVMHQCTITEPQTIYELEKTGLWGEAVRQRKPIIDNHFTKPGPLKKGTPRGHAPLHKFLTIPIFSEEKIVAVVGVANKSDDYNDSDIRQLQLMMDTVWKIVKRREDDVKIRKLNRLYAFISQVNQAIVHNRNRQKLFDEVCRIAIEHGKFRMAWIGMANTGKQVVKPCSWAGLEGKYLSDVVSFKLTGRQTENGPSGTAIREKKHVVCNNIETDTLMALRREEALKRGYQSVIALPLTAFESVIGSISIYSDQAGFFTSEEIKLLDEVVSDINYALEAIETEKEHKSAVKALKDSEAKFRNLVNQMQFGLAVHEIILDEKGKPVDYRFLDVNPGFEGITGLKKDEIIGKTVLEVLPDTEKKWIEKYGEVALTGKPVSFENYARELERHYSVLAYRPQPNQFAVITEDITRRKSAEEALSANMQKLKELGLSGNEMLKLPEVEDIYNYLTEMLHKHYPDTVILFSTIDESQTVSYPKIVKGISTQIINKTNTVAGFNIFKKGFKVIPFHQELFVSGKFHSFDQGLTGFSGPEFPELAAKTIEKLLNIKQIYTIGINKGNRLYATIHFFHRSKKPISDTDYIELFVRQAGIIIERKLYETQLRESEERHRLMFETSQEAIVIISEQKIVYFNPKLTELIGYPREEVLNEKFAKFIHPDDINRVKENYSLRMKGKPVVKQYQLRVVRKNGSIRWATLSGSVLNWNGKPSGFYFLTDVTELILAEHNAKERLKELSAFYRLSEMTENRQMPIDDLYRRFTNVFPESMQYPGLCFARLEVDGVEYKTPNYTQKSKWKLSAPIKVFDKKVGEFEAGYLKAMPEKDKGPFLNEELWLVNSIAERLGHITERKKAEEQLRQSEQKFRLLFENSPLGIYIGNADGTIEEGNEALLKILGSPSLEATKRINVLTYEPLVGNGYAETYKRCIKENSVLISEIPYKSKWGKDSYLSSYLVPLEGPSGKVEKVFTLMEDITQRKEIEKALKETADELKQLNITKDKFFSIIAHDLRAPFASLVGFTELMADEKSKFSVDEYLQYSRALNRTAHSASSLLENLLEWSRLQRNTMPFEPRKINLDDFFSEIEATTRENAEKKSINVYFDYPDGLLVKADENMLHSIMRNLVSNAIKFTKPGGKVDVKVQKQKSGRLLFTVSDNGIGMDVKRLNNLFRIDTNVSRPGTDGEPSTGLGLILCKEFVEKHGGKIWAESSEGAGSKFLFTLPVKG